MSSIRLTYRLPLVAASVLFLLCPLLVRPAESAQPNIVHIFADDLGYGSVGYNGQSLIQTPSLDFLAAQGMTLDNTYAATVCSPSRAMLLTGMHNGHTFADRNGNINSNAFRAEDVSTADLLQGAGYQTAMIGKHGFGGSQGSPNGGLYTNPVIDDPSALPNNLGFDYFYGYLDHTRAHHYNVDSLWETDAGAPNGLSLTPTGNTPGNPTAVYTHDLIGQKSLDYVEQNAGGNPFYMQVNYTIPHAKVDDIDNAPGGLAPYTGESWTTNEKRYAAMITRMDASIGSLIDKLDDPNGDGNTSDSVLDNTLVIFTSDNGATQQDAGAAAMAFFNTNGGLRGTKRDLYEGGIHVPGVAYWRGTIAAGTTTSHLTDLSDFMPTAAELAGVATPVGLDGVSMAALFTGQGIQRQHDYLIFEHHEGGGEDPDSRSARWAILKDNVKLIKYSNGSYDMFNLVSDPDENSPLPLSGANLALKNDLEAIALAEGVQQGDSYAVTYRTWTGPDDGDLNSASHWNASGTPADNWSAVVNNGAPTPQRASVGSNVTTLGFEVRGDTARQTVEVLSGKKLIGRNEVRISNLGRIELTDGTLESNRWTDVLAGGQLSGHGDVNGDVYNQGDVAPGRSGDLPAPPAPPAPNPIAPSDLDTGVISAVDFDFTGIQDDAPITQTSNQNQYLEVTHGFDLGPGLSVSPGSTNAGDEFNLVGFTTSNSLQDAIDAQDYLTFTVEAENGAGIVADDVSFRLWRNGANAAKQFAIFSSVDGFEVGDQLSQFNITDSGIGNQHTITGPINASGAAEAIEFRLYGWDSAFETGNSHFNLAGFDARIVAAPTMAFDFTGVQDNGPITATTFNDNNMTVTSGFAYGPGLQSKDDSSGGSGNATNVGDEFNATGFTTGNSLQDAINENDYLTFEVQAVAGLAMTPESVRFSLWRNGPNAASDYAILSSIDGFSAGQALAQATYNDDGQANEHVLEGTFAGATATSSPIEFRLYGWDSGADTGNTHFTAASLRADFSSVAGQTLGPAGTLTLNGDFFHLEGGVLAIEIGGLAADTEFDLLEVFGEVDLAGDLNVSLIDLGTGLFAPVLGDRFEILTASGGVNGQFAVVDLLGAELAPGLFWSVDYDSNSVSLDVVDFVLGDLNGDGVVTQDDVNPFVQALSNRAAYDLNDYPTNVLSAGDINGDGMFNLGDVGAFKLLLATSGGANGSSTSVPEPTGAMLFLLGGLALSLGAGRNRRLTAG